LPSLSVPATQSQGGDFGIKDVRLFGTLRGTFYLDDIRLVTGAPPTGTAVLETLQDAKPNATALGHNFPNPFNAQTVIPFELHDDAHVSLIVYNLSGQRVADLVRGFRPAGIYQAHWDGLNDAGFDLASGTYLIRLQVGAMTETRKLLLLR
jgi:hypothetical protein